MAAVNLATASFSSGGSGDTGDFASDPSGLLAAIDGLSEVSSGDDSDTLVTTVDAPADLVAAFGSPIPTVKVELDVGDDDLPSTLRFRAKQGAASARYEVDFSRWNDDFDVRLPSQDELDATPWVDEEGLRAIKDVQLVWPTDPPTGWVFTTWSPEEIEDDGSGCELVELDWDEVLPDDATTPP